MMLESELKAGHQASDIAYGVTPEDALRGVLERHDDVRVEQAEYLGERPAFMDVAAKDAGEHNWSTYPEREDIEGPTESPEAEPWVRISEPRIDHRQENRIRIELNDMWLEVDWRARRQSWERAQVQFVFVLQLREREWQGIDTPHELDGVWKCERLSTEPL